MAKIGILGGTFNPIHNGHIELGKAAVKECNLDKILVIPSGISYLKKDISVPDGNIRYAICEQAIKGIDRFEMSDIEIKRMGNTYTYQTLEELKEIYKEDDLYFILGADSLFYLENWVEVKKIFEYCTIVCANRGTNSDIAALEHKRNELISEYKANIILLKEQIVDISSTKLREYFVHDCKYEDVQLYVSYDEYQYIISNNIYKLNE